MVDLLKIQTVKRILNNQSKEIESLGKGLFWSITGSMISRIMLFLAWIIIARILGREQYGEYGLIRNTIMMFATFAVTGMGQATTKFVAEYIDVDKNKAERIAGLISAMTIFLGIIVFIVALIYSPMIAEKTMNAPWLANDFKIASFVLLFSTLNTVQIGVLEGLGLFKKVAKINTINGIVSLPLFIAGAYWGGVFGSVIAYGLSYVLLCCLSAWQLRRQRNKGVFQFNYRDCLQEKQWILSFLLPSFMSGIMTLPMKWTADVMLVNSSGFGQLGIFTAAMTIIVIVHSVAVMLNAPFMNIVCKTKNKNNDRVEKFNILLPWFIGILITYPLIFVPELGGWFFGEEFAGETFNTTIIFIMIYALILMYNQGFGRLFALYNLQWWTFISSCIWGGSLIVLFYFLKPYGSIGLALSYSISYLLSIFILFPIYINKGFIKRKYIMSPFTILIWSITAITVFISLQYYSIYINIILGLIIYCFIIVVFIRKFKN